ncbi:MAG: histidine phosphatase family protein [Anaerolineae bacterium]|nr:histidine phosphatase family protein [Anaerolineae bacterium]
MTKTLLIMRHAKSDWDNTRLSDHARPLNKRGKQDAPHMGKLLKREDLVPDLIITSTAERALTTAERVALACDYDGELVTTSRFYLADPVTYLELLQGVDDQYKRVMIVGHNPGMEELLADLTGQAEHFTTANIAHVELPISSWAQLNEDTTGNLLNLWRPKEIH